MLMTNVSGARLWKIILTRTTLDMAYFFKNLLSGKPKHSMAIIKAHIAVLRQIKDIRLKRRKLSYHTKRAESVENLSGMFDILLPWLYFINKKKVFSQVSSKS